MPSLSIETERLARLRERALTRLDLPMHPSRPRADPTRALGALVDLASTPDTAPNALALLHELQVHQVELELQHEDLCETAAMLEAALLAERARFQTLPVACLTLRADGVVDALNDQAAHWLGAPTAAVAGTRLAARLTPDSARALQALLERRDTEAAWTVEVVGMAPRAARVQVAPAQPGAMVTLALWPDVRAGA